MSCPGKFDHVSHKIQQQSGVPVRMGMAVQQVGAGGLNKKKHYDCPHCHTQIFVQLTETSCPKCGGNINLLGSVSNIGMPSVAVPAVQEDFVATAPAQYAPAVCWSYDSKKGTIESQLATMKYPGVNGVPLEMSGIYNLNNYLTIDSSKSAVKIDPKDIPTEANGNPMTIPSVSSLGNRFSGTFMPNKALLNALEFGLNEVGSNPAGFVSGSDHSGFSIYQIRKNMETQKDEMIPVSSVALQPDGRYNVVLCHVEDCKGNENPEYLCRHKMLGMMGLLADKNVSQRLSTEWLEFNKNKKNPEYSSAAASILLARNILNNTIGNGAQVNGLNDVFNFLNQKGVDSEQAKKVAFAMEIATRNLLGATENGQPAFFSGGLLFQNSQKCVHCGQFVSPDGGHNCPALKAEAESGTPAASSAVKKTDPRAIPIFSEVIPPEEEDYGDTMAVLDNRLKRYSQFNLQSMVKNLAKAMGVEEKDIDNYPLLHSLQSFISELQEPVAGYTAIDKEFVLPARTQLSGEELEASMRSLARKMPNDDVEGNFQMLMEMFNKKEEANPNWDLNYPGAQQVLSQVFTYLANDVWGTKEKTRPYKRAFLLRGAPGVGKTEAAHILGMLLKMPVVDISLFDTDSQELVVKASLGKEGRKSIAAPIVAAMVTGSVIVWDELPNAANNEMFTRISSLLDQGYIEIDGERWPISERTIIWATGNYMDHGANVGQVTDPLYDRFKTFTMRRLSPDGAKTLITNLFTRCRQNSIASADSNYKLPDGTEFKGTLMKELGNWYAGTLGDKENNVPGTRKMMDIIQSIATNGLNPQKLEPLMTSLMSTMLLKINNDSSPTEGAETVKRVMVDLCGAFEKTVSTANDKNPERVKKAVKAIQDITARFLDGVVQA